MKIFKSFALVILTLGIASCNLIPRNFDLAMAASDGKDFSVVLAGCNQGIHSGYLFCRKNEASLSTEMIDVYAPKVSCNRDSCTELQFLNKDGSFGFTTSIAKEKNKVSVALADIIGNHADIIPANDGEYSVLAKIWFIGPDKSEHIMFSKGVIRVLVLSPKYQVLACDDPQLGWSDDISETCHIDHSTAYRSAVCGNTCEPKVTIQ